MSKNRTPERDARELARVRAIREDFEKARVIRMAGRRGGKSQSVKITHHPNHNRCEDCMATGWQAAARACHMRGPHVCCAGDALFPGHRKTITGIDNQRRATSRLFNLGMWASIISGALAGHEAHGMWGWPGLGLGLGVFAASFGITLWDCNRRIRRLYP